LKMFHQQLFRYMLQRLSHMNKIFVAKFSWNKDWEPAQIYF